MPGNREELEEGERLVHQGTCSCVSTAARFFDHTLRWGRAPFAAAYIGQGFATHDDTRIGEIRLQNRRDFSLYCVLLHLYCAIVFADLPD